LALYDIHIREDGFQWDSFSLNFVDFVGDLIRAKASKNPLKWVGGVGWMILVNGKKPTGKLEGLNHIWWPWADDAQLFVEAINILAAHAIQNPAKEQFLFEDFREKARSWRDLPTKPELPEEARRHRVLAENALLEKDLDRALAEYEAGLESYPLWPQGQFDAALLCEQKKLYSKAVGYMKRYLELAPDAPDARAARDKIIIWQDKLNR
jgi:tetratricopeptide (TPR) repeat protein